MSRNCNLAWLMVLIFLSPGCGHTLSDTESPSGSGAASDTELSQAPDISDPSSSALAHPAMPVEATPAAPTNSFSAIVREPTTNSAATQAAKQLPADQHNAGSLSEIGVGHFNGHHEQVVFRVPPIRALKLSPDGKFLCVARQVSRLGALLQVWDVTTGSVTSQRHEPLGITAVAFDPSGKSCAYGAGDHCLVLQTLPSGPVERWNGHRLAIGGLDFSADGRLLASFGNDGRLLVWDVSSPTVTAEAFVANARFASEVHFVDVNQLWTRGNDAVVRWYSHTDQSLSLIKEVKLPEKFTVTSADDQNLYGLFPERLDIVEAATGNMLPSIPFDDVLIEDVTTTTDEERRRVAGLVAVAVASTSHDLVVPTADGRLILLPGGVPSKKQVMSLELRDVRSIVASPDGRFWSVYCGDGRLGVFDREHPETPQWLEQAMNIDAEKLPSPRFDASRETLISLGDKQTVVVSEISTGLVRRRVVRPASAGEPSTTVTVLAATPEMIFCGTDSGGIEIFKSDAEAAAAVIPVGKDALTAIAATTDSGLLLAGDASGATAWIELAASAVKTVRKHAGAINRAAFSPDRRWAATAGNDGAVVLWDVTGRLPRYQLSGHQHPVQAVAFSPDSEWLVSGDQGGHLMRWRVANGENIASYSFRRTLDSAPSPHVPGSQTSASIPQDTSEDDSGHGITAVAFSRSGRLLAAGTASGYTQTFDWERGTELSPVFQRSAVTDVAFADDGASLLVATQSGDVLRWWRAPDPPQYLEGHQGSVRFAALDAAGRRAVTGGTDRQLRVWDVDHRTLIRSLDSGGEAITAGALSIDGRKAVTSGYGSGIMLWDLAEMKLLGKRYGHKKRVWSFDFTADGTTFATGSDDQTVKLWDFSSQKLKRTIDHDGPVHFVRFSPNGNRFVTSTIDPRGWHFPARLQLWNADNGKQIVEYRGHRTTVNSAVFSPDGNELISCGADGQVCHWNAATGERLSETFRPHGLSHGGLVASGGMLVMRRFSTGIFIDRTETLARMAEFDVPTRSIGDLSVAAQGNRIIAGTEEGVVYVWSLGP